MTWLLGLAVELTWFAVKPPVRDQKTAKQLSETVRPGLVTQSSGRVGRTVPRNTEQTPRRAEESLKMNSLKDFYNIVLDQIEVVHQLWKQRRCLVTPGTAAPRPERRAVREFLNQQLPGTVSADITHHSLQWPNLICLFRSCPVSSLFYCRAVCNINTL